MKKIYHRSCAIGAALVNVKAMWDCLRCGRHMADCNCER